jgi:hypothetical protein
MGLDIFFLEDIRNALLAADEASSSTARVCAAVGGDGRADDSPLLWAYLEGYRAALTTVALAFGLSPSIITNRQGEVLEVKTWAVGETLPADGEDDASPSVVSHQLSAIGHQPKER